MKPFLLFLSQFKSPITLLLIAASVIAVALGDVSDTVIILAIIIITGMLSYWQEKSASDAVAALLKLVQVKCTVVRGHISMEILADQVLPNDIVVLSAGDIIPADCNVLTSDNLFVDEAAFTGETFSVEKFPGELPEDLPISKRTNTLFMGSHVVSGKGEALVIKTGKNTFFGSMSDQLRLRRPETDFEKGIRRFGYLLMEITLILVLIIFATNILLHKPPLDSFLFSLALAIGLTPQLLPAIISVNLSAGARNMARQQVIVKKLSAIENFGSMNILCSDKTGTITEGKVTIHETLDIYGNPSPKTLQFAWLNASMQKGFKNPIDAAITEYHPEMAGLNFVLQSEIPYDFIRKRITVQVKNTVESYAITKGALNNILQICDTAEAADGKLVSLENELKNIQSEYERLSADGYRVLGVAYRKCSAEKDFDRGDERNMIFMGFITLSDRPKKNIDKTIRELSELGVQLKIITGDNKLIAGCLAKQIGISEPGILTGPEMKDMSDRALLQRVMHTNLFAEVEPNQKEKIIVFLKKAGNVVGFIGDGINDAQALHTADVGISVDSAVDVAKEAADIVLLNKDLHVLATGIVAGRKTFINTMKYIFMATSANFGNMFSMAGASLFLPFLPLLPKQILLMNLLTDFPEMTIATDRVDEAALKHPRKWDIRFIRRFMIVFGLTSSIFDYITFAVLLYFLKADTLYFRTGWFVESVVSASVAVLLIRTRYAFFKSLPGKYLVVATLITVIISIIIPFTPIGNLLGFAPLPVEFYCWMALIIALYILSVEMIKKWFYSALNNRQS